MVALAPLNDAGNAAFVSYDALLIAVDRGYGSALPAIEAALETRSLSTCARPFGAPSAAAKAEVQSGKVKLADGTTCTLAEKEKAVALAASEKFALNEVDAAVLLRGKRLDAGRAPDDVEENETEGSETFWDQFLVYYLHQRLQALRLVTQLVVLEEGMDEESTTSSTVAGIALSRAQKLDKRELATNCIKEFVSRCSDVVPAGISTHPRRAAFFAKELVREQTAILTLAFICCNQTAVDSKTAQAVLEAARKTEWAKTQANEAFFDLDARAEIQQVEHLLVLLSVAALNLEIAALPDAVDRLGESAESILHSNNLVAVHRAVLQLVTADAVKAAPLLLGWSLVLFRLMQALNADAPPPGYEAVTAEIPPNFYEQALSHALDPRCGLFTTVSQILASGLTRGAYAVLFLDVVRGLLIALPQIVHIAHLSAEQYEAFIATYRLLYSTPSSEALRQRFWNAEDYLCQVEQSFVSSVESRFPAQATDTLRLLTVLAAPGVYEHFDALPSLTLASPKGSLFAPRGQDPTAQHALPVSQHVVVPEGTVGVTLSPPGADPQVVKWDMLERPWSGWTLIADLLSSAAGVAAADNALVHRDDVFSASTKAQPLWKSAAEQDEIIRAVLDFVAAALEHEDIQLFDAVLDVQILFRLLTVKPDKVLKIIVKLLSLKANAIWILLQGANFFPRIATPLLQGDKARGSYATTQALIDLVYHLFLEARNRTGGELEQTKAIILVAALTWARDEVWNHHRGWRYAARRERYELSEQLSGMMIEIVEDLAPTSRDFARSMLSVPLRQAPILSTVATGASAVQALAAEGKVEEAEIVRRAVTSTLQLAVSLLSARRHVVGTHPSVLEHALLAVAPTDHVQGLMKFVTLSFADHSPDVAREACRVLAALTALAVDWPSPQPSLLAHFDEAAVDAFVELLASDRPERDLQITVWSFASAAVETQPGLAMLLVSGRAIRGDEDKKTRQTAVEIAIAALAENEHDAELRAGLYRFLDAVWQRIADYATVLKDTRADGKLWTEVVGLITALPASASIEAADVPHTCYGALARASACNMLATDIRYACLADRKKALEAASVKAWIAAINTADKLKSAALGFLHSACNPSLLQELRADVRSAYPSFELEHLRRPLTNVPALDTSRRFGESYLYPNEVVLAALEAIDPETSYEALEKIIEIDDLHALMDTQMLALIAWRQLLEEAKPVLRRSPDVVSALLKTVGAVASRAAKEEQSGDMIALIHAERLGTVLALLDALPDDGPCKDISGLVDALLNLRKAFDIALLSPLDALRDRKQSAYQRPLFGAAFLLARRLKNVVVPDPERAALTHALDDILRTAILALRVVLSVVPDRDSDADLSLIASVIQSIIGLKDAPPPIVWVATMLKHQVFPALFSSIASMQSSSQRALSLAISLAAFPIAAERMSTEGCLDALANNALSSTVNAGHLTTSDERHLLWVLSLTLVVGLATSLGARPIFMDQVLRFARQCGPQLAHTLAWKADGPLSLAMLDELEATTSLLRVIASRPASDAKASASFIALIMPLALKFIDEATQALSHTNTLVASFVASNAEERAWLDAESGTGTLQQRAVAGPVTQMLLGIVCQVLDLLVAWSKALDPLSKDIVDWPFDRLLRQDNTPDSGLPVISGLLQLADVCIDTLNLGELSPKTATPSTAPKPPLPMSPFDALTARSSATHALESALLLAVSQCIVCAKREKGEVKEEVVDELLEQARRGTSAIKGSGGQHGLLEVLPLVVSRVLGVRAL